MTEQVSQCPNCETSFMVSAAQLRAADGAVRCGACLQVFQAADYFVEAPIADLFAEPVTDEHDDDLTHEPELGAIDTDDLEPVAEQSASEGKEPEAEIAAPEISHSEDLSAEANDDRSPIGEVNMIGLDEAVADGEASVVPDSTSHDIAIDQSIGVHQHDLGEVDESIGDGLQKLEDQTPDELVPQFEAMPARYTMRWFVGVLLLIVSIGGQYFWFEREIYSAEPMLRPYYAKVCNTFNCTLPEMSDVNQLQTDDLVVRSLPGDSGGLVVDVLLRNEAPFRQRFPGLLLQFSTIQGDVLAERIFRPEQYLAGEMAGLIFVPASTEVRLSLEIVDPGPEAVGYSMVAVATH